MTRNRILPEATGLDPEVAKDSLFSWSDYVNNSGVWADGVGAAVHRMEQGIPERIERPDAGHEPPAAETAARFIVERQLTDA